MAGSPKKRARKEAKKTIERAGMGATTREHFDSLVESFQTGEQLGQVKACIADAIARYQDSSKLLIHPEDLLKALTHLVKAYEVMDRSMISGGFDSNVKSITINWGHGQDVDEDDE
jgi:hypothetical protein